MGAKVRIICEISLTSDFQNLQFTLRIYKNHIRGISFLLKCKKKTTFAVSIKEEKTIPNTEKDNQVYMY